MSGKETSSSISKGGHTQGTAQDEGELEQKEAGVLQEDTVLAQGATPGNQPRPWMFICCTRDWVAPLCLAHLALGSVLAEGFMPGGST